MKSVNLFYKFLIMTALFLANSGFVVNLKASVSQSSDLKKELIEAIKNNDLEAVKNIIYKDIFIDEKEIKSIMFNENNLGADIIELIQYKIDNQKLPIEEQLQFKLAMAIYNGDYDFIKKIIDQGIIDINKEIKIQLLSMNYKSIAPINLLFAQRYHIDSPNEFEKILDLLIKSGADINKEDIGYTPLYRAISSGDGDLFKKLLSLGADISIGRLQDVAAGFVPFTKNTNWMMTIFRLEDYLRNNKKIPDDYYLNELKGKNFIWFFNRVLSNYPDRINLFPEHYQKAIDLYKRIKSHNLSINELKAISKELSNNKYKEFLYGPIKLIIDEIIYLVKKKNLIPNVAYKIALEF